MRLTKVIAAAVGSALLFAGVAAALTAPKPKSADPLAPAKPAAATAAASVPITPVTSHSLDATDVNAWLDGYMPYALHSGDIAGAVVLVVKDGKVLTQRGYGYSDVDAQKSVDPETTMFRPGSVSKLYTWTAVMQQVEAGKLNLDADVNTYLDFKIPPYQGKPITLRNLMTHTAGFEETIKHLIASDPKRLRGLGEILKLWTPERIYAPGEVPAYSNYGAALAGYIVERVSHEPFDQYVDHHIFQPLGMEHATFTQPLPAKFAPFMAKGYMQASQPAKPYELVNAAPAGSSAISGGDMAKFMIAHLQDGQYNGVQILKPETARLMHTMVNEPTPPFPGMALGFYRDDKNGHEIIAHGGDTVVFHSDLNLFIKDGVGLYISMNSIGREGAAQNVRAQLLREFADRYFPAAPTATLPTWKDAKADAKLMQGTYWASRRSVGSWIVMFYFPGQTTVKANADGTLEVSSFKTPGGGVMKFREVGPYLWQEVNGRTLLKAVVKDGKVVHFTNNDIPAIEEFQPTPFAFQSGWNMQVLMASCLVLLSLIVSWIVAVFARRKYGHSFALTGRAALFYRLVRITAIIDLVVAAGWFMTLMAVSKDFSLLDDNLDLPLHVLQFGSLIAVLGGIASIINVVMVWRDKTRGWFGKLSSIVVMLACLDMVWFVFLLSLLGPGTNF